MRFTALCIGVLLCGCASNDSAPSQNEDPLKLLNGVGRRLEVEEQQNFEDRQQQRLHDQQEQAYDRHKCIQAGYGGPDVEQCVRETAALRRDVAYDRRKCTQAGLVGPAVEQCARDAAASRLGARPGHPPRAGINCTTMDLGEGTFDTVCD
jgi:hypothetical protein